MFYMHENAKFLIFKFSKVMQQHTWGVVGNLILIFLEIYCSLQQWKNVANPARIDKVIDMVRVAPLFDSRCIYTDRYYFAHTCAIQIQGKCPLKIKI